MFAGSAQKFAKQAQRSLARIRGIGNYECALTPVASVLQVAA
jgi:hypothetical protein